MRNYGITIRAYEEPDKYLARAYTIMSSDLNEAYREAFEIFMSNLEPNFHPESISVYGEEM